MINTHTLDQAIIEAARFLQAAKHLRLVRKAGGRFEDDVYSEVAAHSAALRSSMDLTRKLADLRQGR